MAVYLICHSSTKNNRVAAWCSYVCHQDFSGILIVRPPIYSVSKAEIKDPVKIEGRKSSLSLVLSLGTLGLWQQNAGFCSA